MRDERVDAATQGAQPLPGLVIQAIRKGWAIPDARKPELIDELLAIIDDPEVPNKLKVAAFNALRAADKDQYERDNPDAVRSPGAAASPINISLQMNIAAAAAIRGMVERGEVGEFEPTGSLPPPNQPSAFGNGGLIREVDTGAPFEENERRASPGMPEGE